ncbi:hypothetical protein CDAR_221021 [Caerostris darwini]|uniref:Uncharacterized protein n=1 Tax=Caerostris darwini TaxID=1538125 RepID=A0AAV4P7A4_9ARAC|nr:hypothetical protein CDAR_221021 [Caerostris darwini]
MALYKKQNKIPLNGTTVNGAHLENNWKTNGVPSKCIDHFMRPPSTPLINASALKAPEKLSLISKINSTSSGCLLSSFLSDNMKS